jgi:hypothetical protein
MPGTEVNTIVKIDTQTNELSHIDNFFKEGKPSACCLVGNKIFFPSITADTSLLFDMEDDSCDYISTDFKGEGFQYASFDGEKVWLCQQGPFGISYCDIKSYKQIELYDDNRYVEGEYDGFCLLDGYLYAFSNTKKDLFSIDIVSMEVNFFEVEYPSLNVFAIDKNIYLISYYSGVITVINSQKAEINPHEICINNGDLIRFPVKNLFSNRFLKQSYIIENHLLNLGALLRNREWNSILKDDRIFYGNEIYGYVKTLIN